MVKTTALTELQDLIVVAVFDYAPLRRQFVLKGAHAVRLLGRSERATQDIDLASRDLHMAADENGQRESLRKAFREALDVYCETYEPDWSVYAVSAEKSPAANDTGWDGTVST